METLTVQDVFIPLDQYPNLPADKTLHEAIQVIHSFKGGIGDRLRYSELLVVSEHFQLLGRLNIVDILYAMAPRISFAKQTKKFEGKGSGFPNLAILLEDSFLKECSTQVMLPIKNFMNEPGVSVKADSSMLKALMIMLNAEDYSLPVAEGDRIIGVIRLEEIFSAMYRNCIG